MRRFFSVTFCLLLGVCSYAYTLKGISVVEYGDDSKRVDAQKDKTGGEIKMYLGNSNDWSWSSSDQGVDVSVTADKKLFSGDIKKSILGIFF